MGCKNCTCGWPGRQFCPESNVVQFHQRGPRSMDDLPVVEHTDGFRAQRLMLVNPNATVHDLAAEISRDFPERNLL